VAVAREALLAGVEARRRQPSVRPKITAINQDEAPHTVTADDKSFDTGTISGGQRGEITASPSRAATPTSRTIPYMNDMLIAR
jgi:hypothetical protein